jgi:hypothetical protein
MCPEEYKRQHPNTSSAEIETVKQLCSEFAERTPNYMPVDEMLDAMAAINQKHLTILTFGPSSISISLRPVRSY